MGDTGETGETISLTYRQLAQRLGLNVEAAKSRARRAGWTKSRGNDDAIRLLVPLTALDRPARRPQTVPERPPPVDATDATRHPDETDPTVDVAFPHSDTPREANAGRLDRLLNEALQATERAARASLETDRATAEITRLKIELGRYELGGLRGALIRLLSGPARPR